jgi:hypothetical protein
MSCNGGTFDTAVLSPIGRLTAEYTLADNVVTTQLDKRILVPRQDVGMHCLDGHANDFLPDDQLSSSASGRILSEEDE